MAKPTTQKSIAFKTKKFMTSLGVYKPEFEPLIDIYASMQYQYNECLELFEEQGRLYTEVSENSKGVVNEKKSPLIQTIESLRKDILAYSDKLCLNPKTLNEEKQRQDKSKPKGLEAIVADVIGGADNE